MASAAPQTSAIDIGRIVGRGFTILKGNFLPFFAAALVLCGIPWFVIYYLTAAMDAQIAATDTVTAAQILSGVGALLVTIVTGCLLQGILSRSTLLAIGGRSADVRGSVAEALRLLLPILAIAIITAIGVGVGFVFLIVPGIIVYILLIVAVPALIAERGGVSESLSRSVSLTAGSRLMIFLLAILFVVAALILSLVIGLIVAAAAAPLGGTTLFVEALADGVDAALAGMLAAVMISSLYVELRVIKDSTTPERIAAGFGTPAAHSSPPSSNLAALAAVTGAVAIMVLLSYLPWAPVSAPSRKGAEPVAAGPLTPTSAPAVPGAATDPRFVAHATRASLRGFGEGICQEEMAPIRSERPDIDFDSICRCVGERIVNGVSDAEIPAMAAADQEARLRRAGRECFPGSWPDARPEELAAARVLRHRADGVAACLAALGAAPHREDLRSACECAVDGHMRETDNDLTPIVPATWLGTLEPRLQQCRRGNQVPGLGQPGEIGNVAAQAQEAIDALERSMR